MALKKFTFHLGPHKTGTTFQQNSIRESLSRGLGMKDGLEFIHEKKLVAYIVAGQPKLQEIWQPFRAKVLLNHDPEVCRKLAKTLSGKILEFQEYEHVALINENLIGPQLGQVTPELYPCIGNAAKFWNEVRKNLAASDVEMSLYASFRKQAGFVESTYVNVVRDGKPVNFRDYFKFIDSEKLHWSGFFERVFEYFPKDKTRVVPFEQVLKDAQEFVNSYTQFVDEGFIATKLSKNRRDGFSKLALQSSLDGYPFIKTPKARSHLANSLFELMPKSDFGKPDLMTKEEKSEMTAFYKADNRKVFKTLVDEKYFPLFREFYRA